MSDDADTWNPVGIDTSPAFQEYVAELRRTALFGSTVNYGPSTDTRRSKPMSTTEQSLDDEDDLTTNRNKPDYGMALARLNGQSFFWLDACEFAPKEVTTGQMGRRAFMTATAVAAITAAGVGTAAANAEQGLNYDSKLVPDVHIPATATIGLSESDMGPLEYINDSDEVTNLGEFGGVVAPGPDNEDNEVPETHNPFGIRPNHIDADVYSTFPADETFVPSGEEEEEDLSALDERHWTTDADLTIADSESPGRGMGLNVSATGIADGTEVTGQFTDVNRDSGIDRTYLQIGYTVNSLATAATFYVRVRNTSTGNSREVMIQEGADTSNANVIGTGDETGAIRQVELGDLTGTLEAIDKIELAIADGDGDIDLFAFAVERPDRWEFGDEEYVDADDELDTQTIYEPTGLTWISSYDSLPDWIRNARVFDREVEIEFQASELPADRVDVMFEDAERYSEDQHFNLTQNLELPVAFDLDLDVGDVTDVQRYPQDRYLAADTLIGDQDPVMIDDLDDHEGDFTDRTSAYDVSLDEEVSLTSLASQGDMVTVSFDILVMNDQAESIQDVESSASGGGLFGMGREGGGGLLNRLISLPGMLVTAVVAYGGFWFARARGIIGGVRG